MGLYLFIIVAAALVGIAADRLYAWVRAQRHGIRIDVDLPDADWISRATITIENKGSTIEQEVHLRMLALFESLDPPDITVVSATMKRRPGMYAAEQYGDEKGSYWYTWIMVIDRMRPKDKLVLSVDFRQELFYLHLIAAAAEIADSFVYPDAGGGEA